MDAKTSTNQTIQTPAGVPKGQDFLNRIDAAVENSKVSGKPFIVVVIQLVNLPTFKKRNSAVVLSNLFREIYLTVRNSVHSNQFVGVLPDGLGLVFEGADVGQVDTMSRRLVAIAQHVIRTGKYNDLSSRWTDIIQQFLSPSNPGIIFPRIGWSLHPRDGAAPKDLVNRAIAHMIELSR